MDNQTNILTTYIVYSMITIIVMLCLLVIYHIIFVQSRNTPKNKWISKFNLEDKLQETEDTLNDSMDRIMEKKSTDSSFVFLGLAFVLTLFGVSIGCYILEYFILFIKSDYAPLTNANSANIITIILLIPFCVIIWFLIFSFLIQSIKNL